jgi:hypothetical protein
MSTESERGQPMPSQVYVLVMTQRYCLAAATQTSVPPTVLSFQQSTGWLDPFSACETVVTVTGSCKGPQRLLIRLSSNSNACKSCSSNSNTCSSRIRLCEADARELQPDCSCSVEYVQVLVQVSAPKVALNKYR